MIILGINAYHAEASAALIIDGNLVAAAEEERFVRIKHLAGFPSEAVRYCLESARVSPEKINAISISRNPSSHWPEKAAFALRQGLFSKGIQNRVTLLNKLREIPQTVTRALDAAPKKISAAVHFVEHHRSHIGSSFYASGWDEAAVLSLDGFGDFLSGLWGTGRGNRMQISGDVRFPHSLGILYTAITQYLGFLEWGDEYKVMGLAAYGKPDHYRKQMQMLVQQLSDGQYRLNLNYFQHQQMKVSMTWESGAPSLGILYNPAMEQLLGPRRDPKAPFEERHAHIAAALQERLEEVVLSLLRRLHQRHPVSRLCYAGGVALNCVLNGRIRSETPFKEIFIQPAAHDAGTSLGAALYTAHQHYNEKRVFRMQTAAWGPEPDKETHRRALEKAGLFYRELNDMELCETTAEALAQGKIVGWFQGRMEFGPRALGHRSLLADPRDPKMKDRINERIKRRESFRPFAPSVAAEAVSSYYENAHADRFMLFTFTVRAEQREKIPAVTHVDGTGRVQAVFPDDEPLYYRLIKAFEKKTGVPVILNTSFNEREPIVCRSEEAIACVQRNSVDCLALGPFWVSRGES